MIGVKREEVKIDIEWTKKIYFLLYQSLYAKSAKKKKKINK